MLLLTRFGHSELEAKRCSATGGQSLWKTSVVLALLGPSAAFDVGACIHSVVVTTDLEYLADGCLAAGFAELS